MSEPHPRTGSVRVPGADAEDAPNWIRFCRERDERAFEFLELHPATNAQLVEAGLYPTEQKARERTSRAVQRGQIACIGFIRDLNGHDAKLFARFSVGKPQHEFENTALILAARPDRLRRGHFVDEYESDAELVFGGKLFRLERDRSTESYARLAERFRTYGACPDDVLWVMDTQTRIDGVFAKCRPPTNHWFTTFRRAIDSFREAGWTNIQGAVTTI
jgi:hypothetical protein